MDNKLEYIPDDLVMTNEIPCGTAQNVVYRVTSSDTSKTLELDDGTVLKGVVCLENIEGAELGDRGYLYYGNCYACVKDIVPIPLTPEILEKNGWKKLYEKFFEKNVNDIRLTIELSENIYVAINRIFIMEIHYIHELQHLLFGLELNSEMEV